MNGTIETAVGSTNEAKINAVREGAGIVFEGRGFKVNTSGIAVPSGVSDQPMSLEETFEGAKNRAIGAFEHGGLDYSYGLEGGLYTVGGKWHTFGYVVVTNGKNIYSANTASIEIPDSVMDSVHDGIELGDAMAKVFGEESPEGTFSTLTGGNLLRSKIFRDAVISATSSCINSES